jgi:arylsulfatase A-like enzyme
MTTTAMDIVWLVVDSLSFNRTSFAEDGPETTPKLRRLAESDGIVFESAYVPGPLSPSSHAAMLTGELPSSAGMHEVHQQFDGSTRTIAGHLGETHDTYLLSVNMWLFLGLHHQFDYCEDFSREYKLFDDGSDPLHYFGGHGWPESLTDFYDFAIDGGNPIRSLANYLNYRRVGGSFLPKKWGDDNDYQYANEINARILSILEKGDTNKFIFANYMDVHPPLTASDEALERFAPDVSKETLPLSTIPEPHLPNDEKSYDPELMDKLYRAAIWDVDDKLASLLTRLVERETLVIVTSDHGIWDRDTTYSENRLHVPLVIFSPSESPQTVNRTVNLRLIPRTIEISVDETSRRFSGTSLTRIKENQISVTESIHYPNEMYRRTGRTDPMARNEESDPQRDLILIKGNSRVEYVDGSWNGDNDDLRTHGRDILSTPLNGENSIDGFDEKIQERLEAFGYI